MKKMLFGILFLLSGCALTERQERQRVSLDFQGAVYNSISNQYVPQMT